VLEENKISFSPLPKAASKGCRNAFYALGGIMEWDRMPQE
jgi:hypothetical protein